MQHIDRIYTDRKLFPMSKSIPDSCWCIVGTKNISSSIMNSKFFMTLLSTKIELSAILTFMRSGLSSHNSSRKANLLATQILAPVSMNACK